MKQDVTVEDQKIVLSAPMPIPVISQFVGRRNELQLCRAAWGVAGNGTRLLDGVMPLHFRLEGSPGCGKNEIVYEIARCLKLPLYTIQGHEEVTPEDLSLLLVPDTGEAKSGSTRLTLRASPLATALMTGGLFFFDEINRVPERALSPLASVLDSRKSIYSAMTGIHLTGLTREARAGFRFCCALNPQLSDAGRGVLPEYIEERTLPVIHVDYLPLSEVRSILEKNLPVSADDLDQFEAWYKKDTDRRLSVRQALTMMRYASSLQTTRESRTMQDVLQEVEPMVLRPDERGGRDAAAERADDDADDDALADEESSVDPPTIGGE